MKELENPRIDKTEVKEVRPAKRETIIHRLRPQPGHGCFELNLLTREIRLAEFDDVAIRLEGDGIKKKINIKPGCIYTTALNLKNAEKRFIKMLKRKNLI